MRKNFIILMQFIALTAIFFLPASNTQAIAPSLDPKEGWLLGTIEDIEGQISPGKVESRVLKMGRVTNIFIMGSSQGGLLTVILIDPQGKRYEVSKQLTTPVSGEQNPYSAYTKTEGEQPDSYALVFNLKGIDVKGDWKAEISTSENKNISYKLLFSTKSLINVQSQGKEDFAKNEPVRFTYYVGDFAQTIDGKKVTSIPEYLKKLHVYLEISSWSDRKMIQKVDLQYQNQPISVLKVNYVGEAKKMAPGEYRVKSFIEGYDSDGLYFKRAFMEGSLITISTDKVLFQKINKITDGLHTKENDYDRNNRDIIMPLIVNQPLSLPIDRIKSYDLKGNLLGPSGDQVFASGVITPLAKGAFQAKLPFEYPYHYRDDKDQVDGPFMLKTATLLDSSLDSPRWLDAWDNINHLTPSYIFSHNCDNYSKQVYTSMSEALKNPSRVCVLDLRNQNLSRLPVGIEKMINLQSLNLSGNKFTRIPPELSKLKNLKGLFLYGNKLTQVGAEIGGLSKLKTLGLSNNNIKEISPKISTLPALRAIYLDGNPNVIVPKELSNLLSLRVLYLDDGVYQKYFDTLNNMKSKLGPVF